MSKAFTKENDNLDLNDEAEDEGPALPVGFKNYMTPEGAETLKAELKKLLNIDRPEIVKVVSWAASNGDRSENGDYLYGKKRMREIDRRIRFLQKRLDAAEVVDSEKNTTDQVLFGAWVKIKDEDGKLKTYRIVGMDETNPQKGYISWISPVAKALLQARVGDVVLLKTPKGEEEIEIIEVSYHL